jgi:hypothetical protein
MRQPPGVANANSNNALPPVAAAPPLLRAGHAAKRMWTAAALAANGNVTDTELGDHLVFAVDAANALIPGANLQGGPPAWAGPLLGLPGAIAALTASHAALAARLANGLCEAADDPITPVPSAAGNNPLPLPAGFPATRGDIDRMSGAALNNLLAYYGVAPAAQLAARRRQLRRALGVRGIGNL